jgi:hypothetical protein
LSQPYGQDLNWLVTDFTTRVEDVAHAIVVSADGVPLAKSAGIPEDALEQFAAIISGMASLVQGAARIFEGGAPIQVLVEMEDGLMLVKAVSDGSSLAVLASPECDTRQVSFDMTRLVGAVGELLTPAARAELQFRGQPPGGVPLGLSADERRRPEYVGVRRHNRWRCGRGSSWPMVGEEKVEQVVTAALVRFPNGT